MAWRRLARWRRRPATIQSVNGALRWQRMITLMPHPAVRRKVGADNKLIPINQPLPDLQRRIVPCPGQPGRLRAVPGIPGRSDALSFSVFANSQRRGIAAQSAAIGEAAVGGNSRLKEHAAAAGWWRIRRIGQVRCRADLASTRSRPCVPSALVPGFLGAVLPVLLRLPLCRFNAAFLLSLGARCCLGIRGLRLI